MESATEQSPDSEPGIQNQGACNMQIGDNNKQNIVYEIQAKYVQICDSATMKINVQGIQNQGDTNSVQCGVSTQNIEEKMQSLLDKTEADLKRWEKTRESFLPTAAFYRCEKNLKNNGYLNIMGASGDGKTAIAMEMLYNLYKSGRSVIILKKAEQWDYVDTKHDKLVVLIEDIFGRLTLSKENKEKWLPELQTMYCLAAGGTTQIITTCRENIYMLCEKELEGYDLFRTKNANVHLSRSDSDCLTRQEKENVLRKYIEHSNFKIVVDDSKDDSSEVKTEWRISNKDISEIVDAKTGLGFPLCCKSFVSDFEFFKKGKYFFSHPFEVISKVLDTMCESDDEQLKLDYCVLGCVLIYGQLTDECIDKIDTEESDARKKVNHLGKACKLQTSSIMSQNIRDAGDRLKTSYLTYCNNTFSFKHNSMLEAVCTSFFEKQCPLLIQLCEWEILESLVSTEGCAEKTVCVLPPHHYNLFSTRLTTELTESRGYCDYRIWRVLCCWRRVSNGSDDSKYGVGSVLLHRVLTDTTFVNSFFSNLTPDQTTSLMNKVYYGNVGSRSILYWTCWSGSAVFLEKLVLELRPLWPTEKLEEEFREGLSAACRRGEYDVYKYLTTHTDIRPDDECLCGAAGCGSLQIVTDLIENHKPWDNDEIQSALSGACGWGKYDVYEYLTTHYPDIRPDGECLCGAAVFGRLQIVTDLIDKHKSWRNHDIQRALYVACCRGEYDVYKYLTTHTDIRPDGCCLCEAAYCGSLQIVTDLIDNHKPWDDDEIQRALSGACGWGKYDVYQYLTTQTDTRPDSECLCEAAGWGSSQIVTDLIENHKPWINCDIQRALSAACNGGKFDVYKLLMADIDAGHHSVVIDDNVLKAAAVGAQRGKTQEKGRTITSDLSSRGFTIPY